MNDKNINKKTKPPLHQPSFTWRTVMWTLLVWLIFTYFFRSLFPNPSSRDIAYSQFKAYIKNGDVAEITMQGSDIKGQLQTNSVQDREDPNNTSAVQYFLTTKPELHDPELLPLLEEHEVIINAESQKRSWLLTLLISLLPWVLIFGLFFYASRKMQERMMGGGRGDGVFGFARSKAKLFDKKNIQVSYDDVAGLDNAKKEAPAIIFIDELDSIGRVRGTGLGGGHDEREQTLKRKWWPIMRPAMHCWPPCCRMQIRFRKFPSSPAVVR